MFGFIYDVWYTQHGVDPLSGFVGTFWEERNQGRVGFIEGILRMMTLLGL